MYSNRARAQTRSSPGRHYSRITLRRPAEVDPPDAEVARGRTPDAVLGQRQSVLAPSDANSRGAAHCPPHRVAGAPRTVRLSPRARDALGCVPAIVLVHHGPIDRAGKAETPLRNPASAARRAVRPPSSRSAEPASARPLRPGSGPPRDPRSGLEKRPHLHGNLSIIHGGPPWPIGSRETHSEPIAPKIRAFVFTP